MGDLSLAYVTTPDKYMERGRAYASCMGGRRFVVAATTPGTALGGQTSYSATSPTFLIRPKPTATRALVLSNFTLSQVSPAAGDLLHIALVIDSTDRYSSAGTAFTPRSANSDSSLTSDYEFYHNATASGEGAGTRFLYEWTQPVWLGCVFNPDFHDGVVIGPGGSILVYTWAAATAPTWILGGFDVMEDG